jgi:hypothetical protein
MRLYLICLLIRKLNINNLFVDSVLETVGAEATAFCRNFGNSLSQRQFPEKKGNLNHTAAKHHNSFIYMATETTLLVP